MIKTISHPTRRGHWGVITETTDGRGGQSAVLEKGTEFKISQYTSGGCVCKCPHKYGFVTGVKSEFFKPIGYFVKECR